LPLLVPIATLNVFYILLNNRSTIVTQRHFGLKRAVASLDRASSRICLAMAPKACAKARAALGKARAAAATAAGKAKAAAKAGGRATSKAKAAAKARAIARAGNVAMRVDPHQTPRILELLKAYGWHTASRLRNGRSIETIAAHLFQNCDQEQTIAWVSILWYKAPSHIFIAVKERWDTYMRACERATQHGIGHWRMGSTKFSVSHRGAVMGFA
jgi:hypothetical protein